VDRETLYIVGAGVAVGGLVWWFLRDSDASPFDELGDFLVELTSSEEGRINQMQAEAAGKVHQLIDDLSFQGIAVHVGQTLRTAAEEKSVVDSGRSAVTTHSWHELGRAVDMYPIDPDTGKPDTAGKRVDLFQRMHAAARAIGFRGIAFEDDGVTKRYITNSRGKKIWDGGHLEWRAPYGSIAEAVAAEGEEFGIA
jgi:3D (Asp-Asp-Asp) domain-containing protein